MIHDMAGKGKLPATIQPLANRILFRCIHENRCDNAQHSMQHQAVSVSVALARVVAVALSVELCFQLWFCVSFWFWQEIAFGFTSLGFGQKYTGSYGD